MKGKQETEFYRVGHDPPYYSLEHNCQPELPALKGDNDRLQQVLVNLIDNAIKYSLAGGTVTVSAQIIRGSGVRGRC